MGMFTSSKGDYDYTQDYSNFDSFNNKESEISGLHDTIRRLQEELTQLKAEKSGEWVKLHKDSSRYRCSACGEVNNMLYILDNFCCNCGAKMKKEENQ